MDAASFPLHQAAWEGNEALLEKLLAEHPQRANERDGHGNTPLHIAIHRQYEAVVTFLLEHPEIDLFQSSEAGWSLVSEALASGHKQIISRVYKAQQKAWTKHFRAQADEMPDFSMEILWELSSWVPFLNKFQFLPSDTYKVWKKGASVRIDSTLVGVVGGKIQRGHLSLLFFGAGHAERDIPRGALYMYELVWEHVPSHTEAHIEREVDALMRTTQLVWTGAPSDFKLTPALNWRNAVKQSTVAGYACRQFQVESLSYTLRARTTVNDRDEEGRVNHSQADNLAKEWHQYCTTVDSARALLYEKERVREVRKSFAATVSLAENFPRKTKELLALIRLLLPNNGSVAYWGAVLEEKVPQGSFPLKLVSANIAVARYKEEKVVEARFDLPASYKYYSTSTVQK